MLAKHQRRGIANIWFVIIGLMVIGLVGLAVDAAYLYLAAHRLQNAADAAALAGAQEVRTDAAAAQEAAIRIALANSAAGAPVQLLGNDANVPDGDIVIGQYDRTASQFTPTLSHPNAVKVVARRTENSPGGAVRIFFGSVFGVGQVDVSRSAIAMVGGGTGAGLITLNEADKSTFQLSGNITLDVRDSTSPDGEGAIQVNSIHEKSLRIDGTAYTLLASEVNVCADNVRDPPEPPQFDGEVNTGVSPIEDPLKDLTPPVNWGPEQFFTTDKSTLSPGYYPEGLQITGGTVTLNPGIYVLDGAGLDIAGNANLIANGVMFYIVNTGEVDLRGTGNIEITPPIEGEPYEGMAIWQAADNTNTAKLRGTEQFTGIEGTLYFPDARVDITGTSDNFGISQLICDSVEITGTGTLTIHYDGRNQAQGAKVFLVK